MSAQIEMNTQVTEPIVESQEKVKQKNSNRNLFKINRFSFKIWLSSFNNRVCR